MKQGKVDESMEGTWLSVPRAVSRSFVYVLFNDFDLEIGRTAAQEAG